MAGIDPSNLTDAAAGVRPAPAESQATSPRVAANLASYRPTNYSPGRGWIVRVAWYAVSLLLFENGWFPCGRIKAGVLRAFGARIGRGLVIKPRVRIKFPWRLAIGDHCWIGESVWIDNLAEVSLGDHVCISQGVYLCTGSHDFRSPTFELIVRPIRIEAGAWVAARATVLCGVQIGGNAVVAAGSLITRDVRPNWVVAGNPAREVKLRSGEDAGQS